MFPFLIANDISSNTCREDVFPESYIVVLYSLSVYPEFRAPSDRSRSSGYGSIQQGHTVTRFLM